MKRVLLTILITTICLCSASCSEYGTAAPPVEPSAIPKVFETPSAAIEEEEVVAVQSAWTAEPLMTPEPTTTPTPEPTPELTPTPEPTQVPPLKLTFETAQRDSQRIALMQRFWQPDNLLLADETGSVSANKLFFDLDGTQTWRNIRRICSFLDNGTIVLFGIGEDGTVDCVNTRDDIRTYVRNWQGIREIEICASRWIIGKCLDGTVRVLPLLMDNGVQFRIDESDLLGVMHWDDGIAYTASNNWIAYLLRDGTVRYAELLSDYSEDGTESIEPHHSEAEETVREWTDVVDVMNLWDCLVAQKKDGSFAATEKDVQDQLKDTKQIRFWDGSYDPEYVVLEQKDGSFRTLWNKNHLRYNKEHFRIIDWKSTEGIVYGVMPGFGYHYDWGVVWYTDGTAVPFGDPGAYRNADPDRLNHIVSWSGRQIHYLNNVCCVRDDGTVVVLGENECGQSEAEQWTDIRQAAVIDRMIVGLKNDGTVVTAGDRKAGFMRAQSWTGVKELVVTDGTLIGILENGSIVTATEADLDPATIDFQNMKVIHAETWGVGGVTSDGKWQATMEAPENISIMQEQKRLVDIASYNGHVVALWEDGTVTLDTIEDITYGSFNTENITDVTAIAAGTNQVAMLKSDGTVVCDGAKKSPLQSLDFKQFDTRRWRDIVAVAADAYHTVGLKSDGTVVATGIDSPSDLSRSCCSVSEWKDIVAVAAGDYHTVGLKSDGTVVATGINACGCCDVSDWTDIVTIYAAHSYTIGARRDGTILVAGANNGEKVDSLPHFAPFDGN